MANDPKYKVGDTAPGGNKVKQIYGQSDTVFVFKSEQDSVSYFIDAAEPTPLQTAALREFDDVHGLMVRVYPKADWPTVQDELGSALYNALTASTEELTLTAFAPSRLRINKIASNRTRVQYALSSTVAAIVLAFASYLVYYFHQDPQISIFGACGGFAALGAFASVVLRITTVPVDPLEAGWVIKYQGASRVLIGVLFAAFLIAAAKANLIAGIAATTTAALLAYSFLCGFSERVAPELLSGLERTLSAATGTKKE